MDIDRQRIGMIGIGMMGLGIATNLLKHGHALCVMEHPGNQPLDALKAAGAVGAGSAAEVAAQADIVITVLTGAPEVENVLLGTGGVLERLRPGSVVVDCSTSLPSTTAKVAAAVAAAGSGFLDAPMTRTPKEAAEGRLNLLVGGDADVLERCRAVLACFAENILHAGPVGAGHSMKLLHNFVSLGSVALVCEAAACASTLGIRPEVFVDILAKGGGRGVALERVAPYLLQRETAQLRFTTANAAKDAGYYRTMAAQCGAEAAIADAVVDCLQRAAGLAPAALLPELADLLVHRQASA
ncbi:MAG TPA: NAD(P)-dependent oxidoreductase [Rubrivivax sp.]|nr:NAD(P)-dependent oxidoreductase [Rubrivivax sp.]